MWLEEVDPVAPQVNRVQEERSSSLDENIEKLTKLLAGAGPRMGPVKCFPVVKLGTFPAIVDQMCRGHTPSRGIGYISKTPRTNPLRAAGEQPVVVKLDKESGGDLDDVLEMREVMVRTGNDMYTLVIDMTINNHCVEAVVVVGHMYPYLAGDCMIV